MTAARPPAFRRPVFRRPAFRALAALARRAALRLAASLLVLAGVVVITFAVTRLLPGDPAAFQASAPGLTGAEVAAIRRDLGLDEPLPRQFAIYVGALARGDLGRSVATGRPVAEELGRRLPASAELTLAAFALATLVALPLGALAALRRGGGADAGVRALAALALSLPSFVTGLLLIDLFYLRLGWAPEPIGRIDPFLAAPPPVTGVLTLDAALAGDGEALRSALGRLALPAATMAIFALGPLLRTARAAMAAALASDYIRSARANGLPPGVIVGVYAARNALAPVAGTLAMTFSYTLGAGVVVEKVFAWPGLGSFAVDATLALDHAPLQGFMLVMAAVFVAANLATDVLQALVDPRLRADG